MTGLAIPVARSRRLETFPRFASLSVVAVGLLVSWITTAAAPWTSTGYMNGGRAQHTTTILPNGQVLVVGGVKFGGSGEVAVSIVETFDPVTEKWTAANSEVLATYAHTATLMPNGKVLVVGGYNDIEGYTTYAFLYDPATGFWAQTASLANARAEHTATLLPNGNVLITGGTNGQFSFLSSSELYNPTTNKWSSVASLNVARGGHTATLLPNGKILVVGGVGSGKFGTVQSSVELYDPSANTWTAVAPVPIARSNHAASLLPNGKVLVAGGFGSSVLSDCELYDPSSNVWSEVGSLVTARYRFSAALMPSGKVLATGGTDGTNALASAEQFDPASNLWTSAGSIANARYDHTTTVLANGKTLIVAGEDDYNYLATAEVYDTQIGTSTATTSMAGRRESHSATLLPNGKVLVAGGIDDLDAGYLSSAELYDESNATWSPAAGMSTLRAGHTATLLSNGKVLVTGGFTVVSGKQASLNTAELYDANSNTWTSAGIFATSRGGHTATLIGNVLIAGGFSYNTGPSDNMPGALSDVDGYGPLGNSWYYDGSFSVSRYGHTTTLLANGNILIAGGLPSTGTSALADAELCFGSLNYAGCGPDGNLTYPRVGHTATLLATGSVLFLGGASSTVDGDELYVPGTDPNGGTSGFLLQGNLLATPRSGHTATLLPNGKILIAGGTAIAGGLPANADLYDPAAHITVSGGVLSTPRYGHTATLLPNGKVLIAGGNNGGATTATAELIDTGLVPAGGRQPILTSVEPIATALGVEVVVSGSGFRPGIEASDGQSNSSAANFPLVLLTRIDNGQTLWLMQDETTPVTDVSFTAANDAIDNSNLLPGPLLITVFVNGIPSKSVVLVNPDSVGTIFQNGFQ
jgi:N-acetylneuraminic acid mutarotase